MCSGERLATDKRQSSVNGAEMCSLYAAPLLRLVVWEGEGRGRWNVAQFQEDSWEGVEAECVYKTV
jgi:hypothetical protein